MQFFTTQGENWEWCSCAHAIVTRADKKNGSHDKDALTTSNLIVLQQRIHKQMQFASKCTNQLVKA
jgi:hypothetical protein